MKKLFTLLTFVVALLLASFSPVSAKSNEPVQLTVPSTAWESVAEAIKTGKINVSNPVYAFTATWDKEGKKPVKNFRTISKDASIYIHTEKSLSQVLKMAKKQNKFEKTYVTRLDIQGRRKKVFKTPSTKNEQTKVEKKSTNQTSSITGVTGASSTTGNTAANITSTGSLGSINNSVAVVSTGKTGATGSTGTKNNTAQGSTGATGTVNKTASVNTGGTGSTGNQAGISGSNTGTKATANTSRTSSTDYAIMAAITILLLIGITLVLARDRLKNISIPSIFKFAPRSGAAYQAANTRQNGFLGCAKLMISDRKYWHRRNIQALCALRYQHVVPRS